MTGVTFTGERLHAHDDLFAVDIARHRAPYRFAIPLASGGRVLDFGSGSGYGVAEMAREGIATIGFDRVAPDAAARAPGSHFVRGDAGATPLSARAFDIVLSFQVIEHLSDPAPYVADMARLLRPGGLALVTTPNVLTSDRENPYHVHEYESDELADLLLRSFADVEMRGVGATGDVAAYYQQRLARIRRIVRLDPLGLRRRLPTGLVEWLFGRLAVLVRRGIQQGDGLPDATPDDFPIGPPTPESLDLLALCREPR